MKPASWSFYSGLLIAGAIGAPGLVASAELRLGHHEARYSAEGSLLPWTSWTDAIGREMDWYQRCPSEHGYPRFVGTTFMDGNYDAVASRRDFIPATQNGMGIISYLKYYHWSGARHPGVLRTARAMGDYLVKEALTPNEGEYPRFVRSTGWQGAFPQPPDCGSQDDRPYEVQPDKGGIVGYALLLLYDDTRAAPYLEEALHLARVLAAHQVAGDATHSPWPFRVDYRTGEPRGLISGNMAYILRLFDGLRARGYAEFDAPRDALWRWIRDLQVPNAAEDGRLWAQFFEDHHNPANRTAWSPLALARYLIERREALSPTWRQQAKTLIEFVNRTFVRVRFGILVCGEQDEDLDPWGGITSTYGATLAAYSAATDSPEYERLAEQALTFCLYAVDEDGCPRDSLHSTERGGWQEDAHTDKIHNIVDALECFPKWGR